MQIKYVILCFIQHWGHNPYVRKEVEFSDEPSHEQIEEALAGMELSENIDSEIDYSTSAVLLDYAMPRKSKVQRVYAVVEKRFYRRLN